MPNYKVKHTSIMHNGTVYAEGSPIEMTEKQAQRLVDFLELLPDQLKSKVVAKAETKTENETKVETKTKKAASKGAVKSEIKTETQPDKEELTENPDTSNADEGVNNDE